jgi:hypothetical protein
MDGLVRAQQWGEAYFVNLPLIYPSGSFVTARVSRTAQGFRVDDAGFAYREMEAVGAERSFGRVATKVAGAADVETNRRAFYTDASADELQRAICDVAIASWNAADKVFAKVAEQEETEIAEHLRQRLAKIFGSSKLEDVHSITGPSTSNWDVSAILHVDGSLAVFQAVSNHANSVYRTSAAFHDLAALPTPPRLISVVSDKQALGSKLMILSQAGRVIEADQGDEVYLRAAA